MGTYTGYSSDFKREIKEGHNPTLDTWVRDLRKWNEEECECLEKLYKINYERG